MSRFSPGQRPNGDTSIAQMSWMGRPGKRFPVTRFSKEKELEPSQVHGSSVAPKFNRCSRLRNRATTLTDFASRDRRVSGSRLRLKRKIVFHAFYFVIDFWCKVMEIGVRYRGNKNLRCRNINERSSRVEESLSGAFCFLRKARLNALLFEISCRVWSRLFLRLNKFVEANRSRF